MQHTAIAWHEYLGSWHEFYLMAGTAAVTLAGLLFVAISLHIDALIHDQREHLLALARGILFSFVMVLVLSLMMLVPHQALRVTASEMMALGLIFLMINLRQMRWKPKVDHAGFSAGLMRRRMIPPLIGYGLVFLTGLSLAITRTPEMMNFVTGAVCMLLGNAAGASWDLLVRMARIKKDDVRG